MRYIAITLLSFLLLCTATNADAGFVIKNNSVLAATSASKTVSATRAIVANEKHSSFFSWLHPYGHSRNEARIAFFFAMFGLLIPPLGILAIIHGVRSLRRARGRNDGLVVTSIVFGSIEVLITIFYIFVFFLFFFVI